MKEETVMWKGKFPHEMERNELEKAFNQVCHELQSLREQTASLLVKRQVDSFLGKS
jgi:hypothetical protein